MGTYELTTVIPGDASAAKAKSVAAFVKKTTEGLKGKVKSSKEWGSINMAYKIGGSDTGNYTHFVLQLEPAAAKEIDTRLRMNEDIIRYLLIRKDGS